MSLTLAVSSQNGDAEGAESTINNTCSAEAAAADASHPNTEGPAAAPAPGPNEVLTVPVSASAGAGTVATAIGNGDVVKPKQFKAKVTERPRRERRRSQLAGGGRVGAFEGVLHAERRTGALHDFLLDRPEAQAPGVPYMGEGYRGGQDARGTDGRRRHEHPQLSSADWAAYARARQLLDPVGVALETAAAEYADAVQKLAGRASLSAAVEFYLKRHPVGTQVKRVAEVVKECLESKRQDRLSVRYLKQLEYDLNRFAARFKNYIGDISGVTINDWLRSLDVSPRTRNNLRGSFQVLYSFAKAQAVCAEGP